nr:hypothetical protein [uncultured Vibrio sp.]
MLDNVIIGVVAGILTSALLFLITKLFNDSFLPWYRKYLYHGINVSGTWYCYSTLYQKITLDIDQNCQYLKGSAVVVSEMPKEHRTHDEIRMFKVSGKIKDGFVLLSMENSDIQRLGIVSLLVRVSGDGSELIGVSNAYNPSRGCIESHNKSFFRDEERACRDRENRQREFWELYSEPFVGHEEDHDVEEGEVVEKES